LSKQICGRPGTISAGDMASVAWKKEEYYNRPVKALWLRVFVVYARAERYGRINRASVMTVNESSSAPQSSMLKNLRLCMGRNSRRLFRRGRRGCRGPTVDAKHRIDDENSCYLGDFYTRGASFYVRLRYRHPESQLAFYGSVSVDTKIELNESDLIKIDPNPASI